MNKTSDAKLRANKKWQDKNLDRITVSMKKGQKDIIKNIAAENNESINAFINRAIEILLNEQKKG